MSSAPEDHRYALCEADPQRRPGELQYAVYTPQERQDSDHTARREPEGAKERHATSQCRFLWRQTHRKPSGPPGEHERDQGAPQSSIQRPRTANDVMDVIP